MGRREGSIALREEEKKVTADRPYDGTPLSQAAERDTPHDSSPGGGAKSRRGGGPCGRQEGRNALRDESRDGIKRRRSRLCRRG